MMGVIFAKPKGWGIGKFTGSGLGWEVDIVMF
jgi:hypothetical protein